MWFPNQGALQDLFWLPGRQFRAHFVSKENTSEHVFHQLHFALCRSHSLNKQLSKPSPLSPEFFISLFDVNFSRSHVLRRLLC